MSTADDPTSAVRLLWRRHVPPPTARRGPKQRLSVDDVVASAISIADRDGLQALSMRAIARELRVGSMTLYTYIGSRELLVELMVDHAFGEVTLADHGEGLVERLSTIARQTYDERLRRPWLTEATGLRPGLGPNALARYQWQLEALEGLRLDDVEMDQAVTLLTGFAVSAAQVRLAHRSDDMEWWAAAAPILSEVVDGDEFAVAVRVGASAGEEYGAARDPDREFRFGLGRIVDGICILVGARADQV